MQYLIDLTGINKQTKEFRTFRFCEGTKGINTSPSDQPPNVHYQPRISQPGRYKRSLFDSSGRTSGVASVDRGQIVLVNIDNKLDELYDYAFDGYDVVISSLDNDFAPYASRAAVTRGTVQDIQVVYEEVRLQLRSRLALLEQPIQNAVYLGTTTDGTQKTVEGDTNLKDVPRPLLYGTKLNINPVLVNRIYGVYDVGQRFDVLHEVRDKGAKLTDSGNNYATALDLINATLAAGNFATCKTEGLFRIGGNISEAVISCRVSEGVSAQDRFAGAIVSRILQQQYNMIPGVDFSQTDLVALDAKAPFNTGYYTGTSKPNGLTLISELVDSVGGYVCPDRSGLIRFGRFEGVNKPSKARFTKIEMLQENEVGIARVPTGDQGSGIPCKKTIIYYARNDSVVDKDSLSGTTQTNDTAFVDFVTQEWRQSEIANTAVTAVHKLAEDFEFYTLLNNAADAQTELNRRNALHSVDRDSFRVPVKSYLAQNIDLGDVVSLQANRFGLNNSRDFVVIGIEEDHEQRITTLEVWG